MMLRTFAAVTLVYGCLILFFPAAYAAEYNGLPGQELWEPYLEQAPYNIQELAEDPLKSIIGLMPTDPAGVFSEALESYTDVILFLFLVVIASFFLGDGSEGAFLEVLSAGGCGVLLWNDLMGLAISLCDKMEHWRTFLLSFLPVYSGVLAACGEAHASAAANGLLLSGLCFLAQLINYGAKPLIQSYLAVCLACCISTQKGLAETCRLTSKGLRQGIAWAGKAFSFLLGLQRIISCQLDQSTTRIGRFLAGSVPVVGQALSNASVVILSGMQLLKSALGIAALAIVGAEFVPFYITLLLHRILLYGCGMLAELSGNHRTQSFFECLSELVRCMSAITALFFGVLLVGVILMAAMGGN